MVKRIKQQSVKSNFIFQCLYQVIILVIPLVISPYLTRVLGANNLGEYTFVNSIAFYFIIIANLGISNYGQRLIANVRDDESRLRKDFWSLYFVHTIISLISIILYLFFIFFFTTSNQYLYLINIFYVLSATFDITWLFYGLENFKSVVIKNTIIKVLECISIFLFVKNNNSLYIYTWIMCISYLVSQFVMLPQAIGIIKPIKFDIKYSFKHFKPLIILSISVIAASLYTVFDKTLLGIMTTKQDVAYYEYANKIVNIPKQIINVIAIVYFPKACNLYNNKDYQGLKNVVGFSFSITFLLSFASMFGIMAIGEKFSILYFGEDFVKSGLAMVYMSVLIPITLIGSIVRSECLIPAKKDFVYIMSICCGAILNILASSVLINYLGIYGTIIGSIVAEFIGTIIQIFASRKYINFKRFIAEFLVFLICGISMYFPLLVLDNLFDVSWLSLILEVIIGLFILLFVCIILSIIFLKDFKNKVSDILKNIFSKLSFKKRS